MINENWCSSSKLLAWVKYFNISLIVNTLDSSMLAQSGVTLFLFGSVASNSGYSTKVSVILGVSLPLASLGVGFFAPLVLLSFPLALALDVGLFDS
jgi:cell division protein FtsW (lipid II flippase)